MATTSNEIKTVKSSRVPRIDAALKCTGGAVYTSDHHFAKMTYAVPVCATIGKGKVRKIDSAAATSMKGVLGVFTKDNIGALYRPTTEQGMDYRTDEARPPFEDNVIRYYGQYVAVVVAETFELAQAAAKAIKITYDAETPNLNKDLAQEALKKEEVKRGDVAKSFQSAAIKVDQTYVTPCEVHNPIEMHATVAVWEKADKVVIYETSQAIHTHRNVLAQVLGLPKEGVQVITKYLGSGFGGKLWPWPHSALAAATARRVGRPVKLVVDRQMEFTNVGHRPRTQQKIQLSANAKGELQSLMHSYASEASMLDDFKENCGEVSGFLYNVPNVLVNSGVARRNQASPTSMRGPGAVPGLFALESAMDELAIALKMDPVQLRILNDTQTDLHMNKKFSSRHLKECLELGSQKFGWSKRNPAVGSMKDGHEIIGWGVSSCTWPAQRLDADATVEFKPNGRVRVSCGTHDIGTGMYTVLAEIAKEETGIPMNRIDIELGDTALPQGPLAGGSMATGSVVPAIVEATKKAIKNLISGAVKTPGSPYYGQKEEDLKYDKGSLKSSKAGGTVDFATIMKKTNMASVAGKGSSKGNFATKAKEEFSTKSFGAQFVEVGWQPHIGRLRVRRVVSVIDAGRIINYQPAKNQIEGAIVMGIGMGLFEEALYDKRDGFVTNANLADYIMPVHADCPEIDVTFLDYPDKAVNDYGARGVGEIGLAGVASAITAAVYHATGIRVRELPVKIEDLLKSQV